MKNKKITMMISKRVRGSISINFLQTNYSLALTSSTFNNTDNEPIGVEIDLFKHSLEVKNQFLLHPKK